MTPGFGFVWTVKVRASQCPEIMRIAFGAAGSSLGRLRSVSSSSACASRMGPVSHGHGPPPWEMK